MTPAACTRTWRIKVSGAALLPLLESELALARESGWKGELEAAARCAAPPALAGYRASAGAHRRRDRRRHLRNIGSTDVGDTIDVAMFYLSERDVIRALIAAAKRGVAVRVILDPNKDAFGRTKNGIPNRSVATELGAAADGAIKVRWFRTHGEQFHSKLVAIRTDKEFWFTLGSANLTRRNIDDFNLEANLAASVPPDVGDCRPGHRLVRHAVDQPRSAGPGVHGRVRRLRRPGAGHLLAVPHHGIDRPVDVLNGYRSDGGFSAAMVDVTACVSSETAPVVAASNAATTDVIRSRLGTRRSFRREAGQQRAIPMPAQRAVQHHVHDGSSRPRCSRPRNDAA